MQISALHELFPSIVTSRSTFTLPPGDHSILQVTFISHTQGYIIVSGSAIYCGYAALYFPNVAFCDHILLPITGSRRCGVFVLSTVALLTSY